MKRKKALGNICVSLNKSKPTLSQVKDDPNITLLCPDVELTAEVDEYKSVMGEDCTLINAGDYIKFLDSGPSASAPVSVQTLSYYWDSMWQNPPIWNLDNPCYTRLNLGTLRNPRSTQG